MDELVWAALWLFKATGEGHYVDFAVDLYEKVIKIMCLTFLSNERSPFLRTRRMNELVQLQLVKVRTRRTNKLVKLRTCSTSSTRAP